MKIEINTLVPMIVYTVVTRERDDKKFWVRVGDAHVNRDGSIDVRLDAVPTNGTLHLRAMRPAPETEG